MNWEISPWLEWLQRLDQIDERVILQRLKWLVWKNELLFILINTHGGACQAFPDLEKSFMVFSDDAILGALEVLFEFIENDFKLPIEWRGFRPTENPWIIIDCDPLRRMFVSIVPNISDDDLYYLWSIYLNEWNREYWNK